jgi:hypothetical protein
MTQALKAYAKVKRQGITPDHLTSTQIYRALVWKDEPILTDSQIQARDTLGVDFGLVWERWSKMKCPSSVKNFFWRWANRILPINTARGLPCRFGCPNAIQNHDHLIECINSSGIVQDVVGDIWTRKAGYAPNWSLKRFWELGDDDDSVPARSIYSLVLWISWELRNNMEFRKMEPSERWIANEFLLLYTRTANMYISQKHGVERVQEIAKWAIGGLTVTRTNLLRRVYQTEEDYPD